MRIVRVRPSLFPPKPQLPRTRGREGVGIRLSIDEGVDSAWVSMHSTIGERLMKLVGTVVRGSSMVVVLHIVSVGHNTSVSMRAGRF